MKKPDLRYNVVETVMFPKKWKIVVSEQRLNDVWRPVFYESDNATWRYHETVDDAKRVIRGISGEFGVIIPLLGEPK